jgi:hypothetical protein
MNHLYKPYWFNFKAIFFCIFCHTYLEDDKPAEGKRQYYFLDWDEF